MANIPINRRSAIKAAATGGMALAAGTIAATVPANSAAAADADDAAIAAVVETPDSLTRGALNALYPAYRVWDHAASAYPDRVSGAVNIFFGPEDPGLRMQPEDYWANPNVTTMPQVAAALTDTSSPTFEAVQVATSRGYLDLSLTGDPASYGPVEGTGAHGWKCLPDVTTSLAGAFSCPFGWVTARLRIFFVQMSDQTGDIRFRSVAGAYRADAAIRTFDEIANTVTVGGKGVVRSALVTRTYDFSAMTGGSVELRRAGTLALDTFPSDIYILGARLEKIT